MLNYKKRSLKRLRKLERAILFSFTVPQLRTTYRQSTYHTPKMKVVLSSETHNFDNHVLKNSLLFSDVSYTIFVRKSQNET
jgi:hypothetical protein